MDPGSRAGKLSTSVLHIDVKMICRQCFQVLKQFSSELDISLEFFMCTTNDYLHAVCACRCTMDSCESQLLGPIDEDRIGLIVENIPDQAWSEKRNRS